MVEKAIFCTDLFYAANAFLRWDQTLWHCPGRPHITEPSKSKLFSGEEDELKKPCTKRGEKMLTASGKAKIDEATPRSGGLGVSRHLAGESVVCLLAFQTPRRSLLSSAEQGTYAFHCIRGCQAFTASTHSGVTTHRHTSAPTDFV